MIVRFLNLFQVTTKKQDLMHTKLNSFQGIVLFTYKIISLSETISSLPSMSLFHWANCPPPPRGGGGTGGILESMCDKIESI